MSRSGGVLIAERPSGASRVEKPSRTARASASAPAGRGKRVRRIAIVLIAAIAAGGAAAWFTRAHSSSPVGGSSAASVPVIGPVAVAPDRLRAFAASLGHPVYWVGGSKIGGYELTRRSNGDVQFRYLLPGMRAGSALPLLSVGTYPFANAYGALKALAKQKGTVSMPVLDGGIAVYRSAMPTSVYIAYPGKAYEIEIFDPIATRARQLAYSTQLKPIG